MEMSRQRIRSSVLESSTDKCPHCGGTGHVRSVSSVTLHLLRMIEEMLLKGATHNLIVRTRSEVALYVLNHKRAHLRDLESRFQITITVNADASVGAAQPFIIEKGEQVHSAEAAKALVAQAIAAAPVTAEEEEEEYEDVAEDEAEETEGEAQTRDSAEAGESAEADAPSEEGHGENGQRRGRRRRRRGRGRDRDREPRDSAREGAREGGRENGHEGGFAHEAGAEHAGAPVGEGEMTEEGAEGQEGHGPGEPGRSADQQGDGDRRRRRRGRRGGRRNRRGREGEGEGAFAGQNGGAPEDHAGDAQDHHDDGTEAEVADAVADLGGPVREQAAAAEPYAPQPFEPVARETAPPPVPEEPAAAPEPARRRSTVRERAPVFSSETEPHVTAASESHPAPEPEPPAAAPEPAATEEAKPRRFGWWSKRG